MNIENWTHYIISITYLYFYAATKMADLNVTSCNKVFCYIIDLNGSIMNVEINESAVDTFVFCADVENVGGHLVKSYQFAGQTVKR